MDLFEPKYFNFLKKVSIFNKLSDDELQIVTKCLSPKEVLEQELVFARLEREQVLYIVLQGKLSLELIGNQDKYFQPGDVFGEIAVINNNYRSGTIKALEPSLLLCFKGTDLLDENKIPPKTAIKIIIELSKMISSYLATAQNTSTYHLIDQGENEFVEFKSTLRFNLFTKKFDKEIEHACLKTIAAFLNSSGGTLIVGVDDKKQILGIENDQFKDEDHMLLHLTKLIQERIGMSHTRFVITSIEEPNGSKILRIDVKPADIPAYLVHNNEENLFVRTGPATAKMKVSEIFDYLNTRFQKISNS